MTHADQVSETIGYSVIAHKEGALLGGVVHVFFDPDSKSISGMTLKSKTFGKESWFDVAEIEVFGKDVILLKGEASLSPGGKSGVPRGKSLKEMRGMRVVTADGNQIGTLDDLEVQGENWSISELYLDKNRRLPVDAHEIKVGLDQIMVPSGYGDKILEEQVEKPGFLKRIFKSKEI